MARTVAVEYDVPGELGHGCSRLRIEGVVVEPPLDVIAIEVWRMERSRHGWVRTERLPALGPERSTLKRRLLDEVRAGKV